MVVEEHHRHAGSATGEPGGHAFHVYILHYLPGKLQELRRALPSFLKHNSSKRIREYLVVNEYDEGLTFWWMVCVLNSLNALQKGPADKGQARSLNLILGLLRQHRYTYWVHWEESWYCTGRFIDDAMVILDTTQISQVNLKDNHWHWRDDRRKHLKYTDYSKYVHIQPRRRRDYQKRRQMPWHDDLNWWPLFSLMPGVDRVAHILRAGEFDTSASKWPIIFVYEFAHRWLSAGGTVGTLRQSHIQRNPNHRSTYS